MIKIYTDAAFHPQINQAGLAVIINQNGQQTGYKIHVTSVKDNHQAEFLALAEALKLLEAERLLSEKLFFYSDSKIVVQSVEKKYVKEALYQPLLADVLTRYQQVALAFIQWIPEKDNKGADALAKQALHQQGKRYRTINL